MPAMAAIFYGALIAYAPCAVRRRAPGEPLVVTMRDGEPVPLRLPSGAALPANLTAALGRSSARSAVTFSMAGDLANKVRDGRGLVSGG